MSMRPSLFEARWTLPAGEKAPGWPVGFRPLDADRFASEERATEVARSEFLLLNKTLHVGDDWEAVDASQLWRFHLHYWDWCWHVGAHADAAALSDTTTRLYRAWVSSTSYGRLDGWSPYVVSLRLWTWCGLHVLLDAESDIRTTFVDEVRRHAGFLRANLETDVGGNHLFKNLKALVGVGVFLGDGAVLSKAVDRVTAQLSVQVLSDGGHYELSPSYHAQVLGDLIDVIGLLDAAGRLVPSSWRETVERMRTWLGAFIGPDGEVPVFNDAFAVDADELERLGVAVPEFASLTVLDASGYVIARPRAEVQIVIDVGHPCPPELPAHAQADCLSFELVIGDERVIVDAGTSEYGAGEQRRFERSTAAHNTVEVDDENQTDVWGSFRAGRRARPRLIEASERDGQIVVEAEHDGYRHLEGSPIHRRRFDITADGMTIYDSVVGEGSHSVVSRVRIAGAVETGNSDAMERSLAGGGIVRVESDQPMSHDPDASHARRFGEHLPAHLVSISVLGALPVDLQWRLYWSEIGDRSGVFDRRPTQPR